MLHIRRLEQIGFRARASSLLLHAPGPEPASRCCRLNSPGGPQFQLDKGSGCGPPAQGPGFEQVDLQAAVRKFIGKDETGDASAEDTDLAAIDPTRAFVVEIDKHGLNQHYRLKITFDSGSSLDRRSHSR
jgi:hypothetical protein